MKVAVVGTFVMGTLLGHLCMAPVASAAAVPAPPAEHVEMVMTPMFPMSPLHCKQCVSSSEMIAQSHGKTACGDGHCFTQASSTAVAGGQTLGGMTMPPASAPRLVAFADALDPFINAPAPPARVAVTRTIVLLQ